MTANEAQRHLHSLASPEVAQTSTRFFKTGPGQYGEGDIFIGIRVPVLRKVAREYRDLPLSELEILVQSPIHEQRLLALLILVQRIARGEQAERKRVYDFYTRHMDHVNNWDLVDTSAPAIVGGYLSDKSRQPLLKWAKSNKLWERRIAIIATQHFIRDDDFADTLIISHLLIGDAHDLIHKATGWMLREVGLRQESLLLDFLEEHGSRMPRTMLRYAIERLPPEMRHTFLHA